MANIFSIKFVDIAKREELEQQRLDNDCENLEARKKKLGGELSDADQTELRRLTEIKKLNPPYVDPLFVSARAELKSDSTGLLPVVVDHEADGTLKFPNIRDDQKELRNAETARAALILGLLQLNKARMPTIKVAGAEVVIDESHPNAPSFREAIFQAIGKAAGRLDLARKALELLAGAVDVGNGQRGISTLDYARVFTRLVDKSITVSDHNLKRHVEDSLDSVQAIGKDAQAHELEINLPDLEKEASLDVQADHCKLFGSFIFASALEELRAFQVVDTLVSLSQRGTLSLIKGEAGTMLYNYWRDAPTRMREDERQTFYAMTLGLPTGQPGVMVNSDFQDLWLRFVSSVSSLIRETRVDQLLRSAVPAAINQQRVKKAARDLAINMSAHGYGMVFYAAIDLQKQINEMIKLLQDSELRAAFGARDMWGVIDQVAQTELGGARNSSKYKMLATSGAIITSWLSRNVDRLTDPTRPMIDLNVIQNPPARHPGQTAVSAPTDYDLVNACEMWLADSALAEDRVEQMSQPRDSPAQPSRPIQIPSLARELLEGTGLGLGVGMGVRGNGSNGTRHAGYQGY